LILFPVAILTYCQLSTIGLNHRTKFHANILIQDRIIITFSLYEIQDGARTPCFIF